MSARSFCLLATGRVLAGDMSGIRGIWYSDDSGQTWKESNKKDSAWYPFCVLPTGRVVVGSNQAGVGIWYSDDNGVNWVQSNKKDDPIYSLVLLPTGRVLTGASLDNNGTGGIFYSNPIIAGTANKVTADKLAAGFIAYDYTGKPIVGTRA